MSKSSKNILLEKPQPTNKLKSMILEGSKSSAIAIEAAHKKLDEKYDAGLIEAMKNAENGKFFSKNDALVYLDNNE